MHSAHASGYSDFFTSGIRVISRRTALQKSNIPKPIPLSFDGVLSDSDGENEPPKRRTRPTSMFTPFSKSPFMPSSASVQSDNGRTSKSKKHQRSASFMSHLFKSRNSRNSSTRTTISNEESGWLSSASSDSNADFMDLSNMTECVNTSYECEAHSVTELQSSQPEILDPFSSSPSSKSFFVDVSLPAKASASISRDGAIPIHRRRTMSTGNWSNRFSISSLSSTSSSSFFSTSRRNSVGLSSFLSVGSPSNSPATETSFLQIPRLRSSKRSSVERKRPASIHVMTTSEQPVSPVAITKAKAPITVERRYTQSDIATITSHPLLRTASHTRSRSLPLSQPQARSRVRSLFLSKTSSISAAIPESDLTDNDNDNAADGSTDSNCVPGLNSTSTPNPEFQVPDRVSKHNGDGDEVMGPSGLLIVDDEEAPASASDAREFFGSLMDADFPRRVDWRQFCIEILDGHSDA